MKILVLSATPWNEENSFGVSYNNIFNGIPDLQFVNIYCSPGSPDTPLDLISYQMTTSSLIRNLKNPAVSSGKVVRNSEKNGIIRSSAEQRRFDLARTLRWQPMFWVRDMIWKIGRWNSSEFRNFLDHFQADILFQPVYFSGYLNDIAQFLQQYTGLPMVGYVSDDVYTLKQFHLSPLYWADRIWKRRKVRKTIGLCKILYVISDIQKKEYENIFGVPCKVLTKCGDFSGPIPVWPEPGEQIRLLYAGNLGAGRWKSLGLIAESVNRLNQEGYQICLNIYSATPLTRAMKNALIGEYCRLHDPVPYEELLRIQKKADVVIHAEGLSLKDRLAVHQSFSTKLVDYFILGKCIFAVGTKDVASIQHLASHDAAVLAEDRESVYEQLKRLLNCRGLIREYGRKAYLCGKKYHEKTQMQSMLTEDLKKIVKQANGKEKKK